MLKARPSWPSFRNLASSFAPPLPLSRRRSSASSGNPSLRLPLTPRLLRQRGPPLAAPTSRALPVLLALSLTALAVSLPIQLHSLRPRRRSPLLPIRCPMAPVRAPTSSVRPRRLRPGRATPAQPLPPPVPPRRARPGRQPVLDPVRPSRGRPRVRPAWVTTRSPPRHLRHGRPRRPAPFQVHRDRSAAQPGRRRVPRACLRVPVAAV
jgi:hypothetical protein